MSREEPATHRAARFELLLVCAGNVCRSPMAEHAVRAIVSSLPGAEDVRVRSAGTLALPGQPMQPDSAAILTSVGLDGSRFVSTHLADRDLDADLVLVADRAIRGTVATMSPPVLGRLLTMRQAARLLQAVPAPLPGATARERLAALLPAMHAQRGTTPLTIPEDDDVIDPYGGGEKQHRLAWSQMTPLFAELARTLGAHQ